MQYENFNILLDFFKKISKKHTIYIWGTGIYGDLIGRLFNENNICWIGYFDNNPDISRAELNDHRIFDGKKLIPSEKDIFIISIKHYQDVKRQLLQAGIKEEHLVWFEKRDVFIQIQHMAVDSAPYRAKLKKFKEIHTEQRCLIIGNGPSLSIEDLELAKKLNLVSFASNMIYKCYDKTDWRPNYHFFVDANGIRNIFTGKDILNYILDNCDAAFTRSDGMLFDYRDDPDTKSLYYFDSVFSNSEETFEFSSDCSQQIYTGFSVTYAMIQFAVYMGFQEIYLIGMDHKYSIETVDEKGTVTRNKNISDHSDILGNAAMWGVADIYKITKAFESAKQYAAKHGVRIYNATRGGQLEVFERKTLDTLSPQ